MKKNLVSFAMALLPMLSFAYTGNVVVGNLRYHVVTKGKVASVIGPTDQDFKGALVIPTTIECEGVTCDVTTIGISAFYNCRNITSVSIPNSVTSIEQEAFGWCTGLTSVAIPDNITSIGKGIFSHCSQIATATIGNGIKELNEHTFSYCTSLTKVTFSNSITGISMSCFKGCTNLASITLPDNLEAIGGFAFQDCTKLTSITLPSPVFFIGAHAFEGCNNLSSVTFGEKTSTIQYRAFANCTELQNVICLAKKAPKNASTDAFQDSYIEYATLHVPENSMSSYRSTTPWSGFKEVVAISPSGISKLEASETSVKCEDGQLTVEGIDDGQTVELFTLNGEKRGTTIGKNGAARIDTNVRPGSIVVVKMGEKSVKVIVK